MKFSMIVAYNTRDRGIGYNNDIPWRVPEDTKHFYNTTVGPSEIHRNAVVMGRKTWESLPLSRPLKNRLNVVLTKSETFECGEDVITFDSVDSCIRGLTKDHKNLEEVFVIGGSEVYREFLMTPVITSVYVTEIQLVHDVQSDRYFPEIEGLGFSEEEYTCVMTSAHRSRARYRFVRYTKENKEERQYLDVCSRIIDFGSQKSDRTGTGTFFSFGETMRFSLRGGIIPLMTTKRVFWRGVVEELLFFISGATDTNILSGKGIRIWGGNTSREFLDTRGLTDYNEGEMGPMYGFQWRHWGAYYKGSSHDHSGEGIDQLQDCIETIKKDPDSRRIVMSAWNVSDLPKGVLPPCHYSVQFSCCGDELSMLVTMRSVDLGLGFPFNVASYSLLLHMVAHLTDKKPGDIVFNTGDTHVYKNHVEGLKEQISRESRGFPRVVINQYVDNIDGFTIDDVRLLGYYPHQSIRFPMSV